MSDAPPEPEPWEQRRRRVYAPVVAAEVAEHGTIRPPWVAFPGPDHHPLSIGWRMGGGESHLDAWRLWAEDHFDRWDEPERIAYFKRWGVQPRWLSWVGQAVWDVSDADRRAYYTAETEAELAAAWWVKNAETAGLGTAAEYARDFNAPPPD